MTRQFEFINDEIGFLLNSQKDTIDNLQLYLNNKKNEELNPVSFEWFIYKMIYIWCYHSDFYCFV